MVAVTSDASSKPQRRRRRALMILLLIALVAVGVLFAAFILRDGFGGTGSASGGSGSSVAIPKGNPLRPDPDSGGSGLANNDSDSPLTLGGDATDLLIPGSTSPIDVSITNRTSRPVSVGGLSTSIVSVTAPRATVAFPCGAGDYVLTQFVTDHNLIIPASSTVTLAGLGFDESSWPSVTMTSSATDQRGCSNATVLLSYRTTESR